jgi:hypothetical protein
METNQNPVQEQSVQYITPENTQAEQQPVPSPEQPGNSLQSQNRNPNNQRKNSTIPPKPPGSSKA